MPLIGNRTSIALRQLRVRLQRPGPRTPDGDGGYVEAWIDLDPPEMFAHVRPITGRDLETVASNVVQARLTHKVELPFHPGVTTETRVLVPGRAQPLAVVAVASPDERGVDLDLLCAEVVA
jgi:head-tail adaptor